MAVDSASAEHPSVLLLPAVGHESSLNYQRSVEAPVRPEALDQWLPEDATNIGSRITDRLAAWGLRNNTKRLAGSGIQPIVWDRVQVGTLALFSDAEEYFSTAHVIGKGLSEDASEALWGSPEFRWLVLLTGIRDVAIPIDVVRRAAGYAPPTG